MFACPVAERTELRLLEERHADELALLVDRNREHLRAWLPWVDGSRTPADARIFIAGAMRRWGQNNGFTAGIWHEGEMAGTIGLHAIDWSSRASSIGYWIGSDFQGKGIATAACRAVLDHAFGALGLNRVEIRCAPANRRSRAVPERLGFTKEGTLRQVQLLYDRYTDLVVYAMLADEWIGREMGA
ncbi:GNAT family protein [soil metagenome]|nr:GNAT family N-acetyltransferase [Gemmatimonadota bacterium]